MATDEHIVEMQIELNAEIECEFQGEKWLSMQRKMWILVRLNFAVSAVDDQCMCIQKCVVWLELTGLRNYVNHLHRFSTGERFWMHQKVQIEHDWDWRC